MIKKTDFYINGQWIAPEVPNDHAVINPSLEEPFATISLGGQGDVDKAVAAARAAFDDWSQTSKEDRIALLKKVMEVYETRKPDIAEAISQEMGAPHDVAHVNQVNSGTWHFGGVLNALKEYQFEQPLGPQAPTEIIRHEPIGVVGLITPWNWPMNQIVLKVAAALAAGCTMVLKPSEESPICGSIFAEVLDEAGVPAGVFNLVHGDGPGVGTQLSVHPDVDMISFTGSARAGKIISKNAADTLKRVSLELGGKGANIIFADADEKAVKHGVIRMMRNSGQSCNAPSRMLVERARYDQAVEEAKSQAEATAVGPASEEGRHIGPVVNEMQFNKIQGLIETGIAEGARLVTGGPGRPEGLNRGFYVRPTVFADVMPDMTIYREEIFGPVMCMSPFDSEAQAIQMANDTDYGLTNYIQTTDDAKRGRVARRVRSGMVETNGVGFGQGSPFGGFKQSGNGREAGKWGIEDFLEVKAMSGLAAE